MVYCQMLGPAFFYLLNSEYKHKCKCRFLHPLHNFAIVSYNPSDLPEEARKEICAAGILPSPPLKRGDDVVLLGLTESLRVMKRNSIVTNATLALGIPCAEVPRFRAVHEEVLKLDQDFGSRFSGLITDREGNVRALWGSYAEQVGVVVRHSLQGCISGFLRRHSVDFFQLGLWSLMNSNIRVPFGW